MNQHTFVPNSRKLYAAGQPIVGFDVETLQDGSISVTPMAMDTDGEVYHATDGQIKDYDLD